MNGILLVDKPTGRTSHSAVAEVRRALGVRKVGHAGTLDPMATGLLVIGVGPATRLLTFLVGLPKVYEATVRFGVTTTTEDADGEVVSRPGVGDGIPETALQGALRRYTGDILQQPSSVSAIKVGGRRAYDRVRSGEDVELEPRPVTVHGLTLLGTRAGHTPDGVRVLDVSVRAHVSSGTYVRALARDLGETVGTGAHLTALRRTAVGALQVADAAPLGDVSSEVDLLPPGAVAASVMVTHTVTGEEERGVLSGQRLGAPDDLPREQPIGILTADRRLLAVARVEDGRWRYLMVTPS